MRNPFHFFRNERGSVAVTSAIVAATTISFAAVALDGGLAYTHKRRQQTATDMAALAASSNITSAYTTAATSVTSNGFISPDIASVELGTYQPDTSLAPSMRFSSAPTATPNAVRVTMRKSHPFLFGSVVGLAARGAGLAAADVVTHSVATLRNVASFSLGTGLVTLNGGIANSVLSGLTGSSVSLSAMDYQSLTSANVNLFSYSSALATRAAVTGVTYDSLAGTSVSLPAAIGALMDAAPSAASSPLTAIKAAVGNSTATLKLGSLVSFGSAGSLQVGATGPLAASVTALDLVSALLQAANGGHQVQTALSLSLPGVVSASIKLSIGEPAVGSSLSAVGGQGTTLTTAQTRLLLQLQLIGPAQAPTLSVPIVLNIAAGTATLSSIACPAGLPSATVQIGVKPALVDAWIGAVSDATLANFSASLNPPAATLVNLAGILQVTGKAHATIANTAQTIVPFTYADVLAGTKKTVSTSQFVTPLLASLFGNLQLSTSVLGFNIIDVPALGNGIATSLTTVTPSVDTILSTVLATLGVSVGNASVWVSAVQCGQSVLVN